MPTNTLSLFGIFTGSFVLALSGALMPGPLLTVTLSESIKKGGMVGPAIILGHGVLELVLVCLILLGLGTILKTPLATSTIAIIGGGILAWMGISMVKEAKDISLGSTNLEGSPMKKRQRTRYSPFALGIIMSISNPYWTLWWVTVGLGYMASALKFGIAGITSFFLGHILADLLWYSLVSFSVSKGRKIMPDKAFKGIIMACGVILVGFGGWFFTTGFSNLRLVP